MRRAVKEIRIAASEAELEMRSDEDACKRSNNHVLPALI
jgi:hypothetical protein